MKFDQLIKYYIRKIFMEQYAANVQQKLVPNLYLIFINSLKTAYTFKKLFCKSDILKEDYQKSAQKFNINFNFEPNLILWTSLWKKGPKLVTTSFSECQICPEGFLLLQSITGQFWCISSKRFLSYSKSCSWQFMQVILTS